MQTQIERKPARACNLPTAHVLKWPSNFNFHSIKVSADGASWPGTELTLQQAQAVAAALRSHEQAAARRVTFTVGGAK